MSAIEHVFHFSVQPRNKQAAQSLVKIMGRLAERCRSYARESERLAVNATDLSVRRQLEEITKQWDLIAHQVEPLEKDQDIAEQVEKFLENIPLP